MTRYKIYIFAIIFVFHPDNEPPIFANCPDAITQQVDQGFDGAIVTWVVPTATDNSGDEVTLISWDNPGDLFPLGKSNLVYVATDVYGNEQVCTFSVTIEGKAVTNS